MYKTGLWALLGLMSGMLAACDDNDETVYIEPDNSEVRQLQVSPKTVVMGYLDEEDLIVAVRPVATECTWEASDPKVADVEHDETGYHIRPAGLGETDITFKAGKYENTVHITVQATIVCDNLIFMNQGATTAPVQIFPEGTAYSIESANPDVVTPSESGMEIVASAAGATTITVTAEDGQSVSGIQVGVLSPENTFNVPSSTLYKYAGAPLAHGTYGFGALVLSPTGLTYDDPTNEWTGSEGKALFLKLFGDADGHAGSGSYTSVLTADAESNRFYVSPSKTSSVGASYVYDAATGSKAYVTGGTLEYTNSGIEAKIIVGDDTYQFNYSGATHEETHVYPYANSNGLREDTWTNELFTGTNYLLLDTGGTVIMGGWTNVFVIKMIDAAGSNYARFVFRAGSESANGTYKRDGINNGGIGSYFVASWLSSAFLIDGTSCSIPSYDDNILTVANHTAGTTTMDVSGTFRFDMTETVPAINDTYHYTAIIHLNVAGMEFTQTSSTSNF